MRERVAKVFHTSVLAAAIIILLSSTTAGLAAIARPAATSADTTPPPMGSTNRTLQGQIAPPTTAATTTANTSACTPQNPNEANTNIIFCGLVGSSADAQATDLKAYLDGTKTDSKHNDVQSFLQNQGLTDSMFTSGRWVDGEIQKDSSNHGTLVFQGQTVGTNVVVFARCVETNQFCPGSNGAITGSTVLFFGNRSTMPTLIHMTNGVVDFAIESICGNVVTVTPPPVKSLTCDSLTAVLKSQNDSQFTYTLTAQATSQNTPISTFTFMFGDAASSTVTVNTSTTGSTMDTVTASQDHTFTQTNMQQTFMAEALVNTNTTSPSCKVQIVVPAKPAAAVVSTVTTPATPVATATAVPTQLVNTGPGDAVGIFAVASLLGALLHQFVLRRKPS